LQKLLLSSTYSQQTRHFFFLYTASHHNNSHTSKQNPASSNIHGLALSTAGKPDPYLGLLQEVISRSVKLVAKWQAVGFTHGVLNTDNMSILGETIDYGPFGFIERFDPNFTPNTTDFAGRRYAFRNQPQVVQWNLMALATSLVTVGLIEKVTLALAVCLCVCVCVATHAVVLACIFGCEHASNAAMHALSLHLISKLTGLPPWEAPVMIAEKHKLSFSFLCILSAFHIGAAAAAMYPVPLICLPTTCIHHDTHFCYAHL
jgi:hypothetical protein